MWKATVSVDDEVPHFLDRPAVSID